MVIQTQVKQVSVLMRIEFLEVGLAGLQPPDEDAETDPEATPEPFSDLERRFCRTSIDDIYSWTIPLIALNGAGVTVSDLEDVQEFEGYATLIEGIVSAECAVIGLPLSVWEEVEGTDAVPDDTVFVVETSPEVPYHVMVFPFAAALEVIEPITDTLVAIDVAAGRAEPETEAESTPEAIEIDVDADLMAVFVRRRTFCPCRNVGL